MDDIDVDEFDIWAEINREHRKKPILNQEIDFITR